MRSGTPRTVVELTPARPPRAPALLTCTAVSCGDRSIGGGDTPSWVRAGTGGSVMMKVRTVDSTGRRNTSIERCADGTATRLGCSSDRTAADAVAGSATVGAPGA